QWQSKLNFLNTNTTDVNVILNFHADNGRTLRLDFGSGPVSQLSFSIPAFGSRVFRSRIASPSVTTGWASGAASLPVQAVLTFRAIQNGIPSVEISANSTLPTSLYASAATQTLGVAISNRYSGAPVSVGLTVYDSEGRPVGQQSLTLAPQAHTAFTLAQRFPS